MPVSGNNVPSEPSCEGFGSGVSLVVWVCSTINSYSVPLASLENLLASLDAVDLPGVEYLLFG